MTGLDVILRATGPDGAPPLTARIEKGADAAGWEAIPDPGDPWHFTLLGPSGAILSGPAEMMKLTVTADAKAPRGATYDIAARSLLATMSDGRWRTNRARISAGTVEIAKGLKGDLNGDEQVGLTDVTLLLRLAVGADAPNAASLQLGDANCDGKLTIADVTLLLQKVVGLSPVTGCEGG
jgi:hypothetical protein